MKQILFASLFAMLVFALLSCSNKNNDTAPEVPPFPYQEYLDSMGEDDYFPTIGDDGDGFNAISDKIRYPELPSTLSFNLFADSLLQMYNTILAFNTLAYDISTAERYMEESDFERGHADVIESINLSGIKNEKIKNLLANVAHYAASNIRQGKYTSEQEITEVKEFYESYNSLYDNFLDYHLSDSEYSPALILPGYDDIHAKAIADTTSFRDELLQNVLQEQDFEKKCILAMELAYANFGNPNRDDMELVAVIDPILRSGNYSHLIGELWLIWRTALQTGIFSGMSNDSAIYNLFYNEMRNRVALTYIEHLAANPNDDLAFLNFFRMAMALNITRNSPSLFGNNSILDEMNIYNEIWNKEE